MSKTEDVSCEESALRSYLEGAMGERELHQALSHVARFQIASEGHWHIDFHSKINCEVEVTVQCVIERLEGFLQGNVSGKELMHWAIHLTSIDAYVTAGWEDDLIADRFEPMWHILQKLSTPSIDGELDQDRAAEYLQVLKTI